MVKPGEYPGLIASNISGDALRYTEIMDMSGNYLSETSIIYPDQKLDVTLLVPSSPVSTNTTSSVWTNKNNTDGTSYPTILIPTTLSDGTIITAKNKENELTYNYFIKYVYKTGLGYDSEVPNTAFISWARDTYGMNGIEKFWDISEKIVFNTGGDPLDSLQSLLDLGGMIPVFGEPIDGVNAVIYYVRGDKVNSALSAGSAIPFIGNGVAGIRILKKGAGAVDNVVDTTKVVSNAITAPTNRVGLRNALEKIGNPRDGLINPQAHHGLPWNYKDWFASKGLNVNDPQFGAWVRGGGSGGHQSWSKTYDNVWRDFILNNGDATKQEIIDFYNEVRKYTDWDGGF